MPWWKYYGFKENPLSIKPTDAFIGKEEQYFEILNEIESGNMFLIYGPIGSGKTSLAYKIRKVFNDSEEYKVLYFNGEENPDLDLKSILNTQNKKSIFSLLNSDNDKKIIVILDEAHNFSRKTLLQAKSLYDANKVYSVILIQTTDKIEGVPDSFLNRISKKIKLNAPNLEIVKEIINSKLKNKIQISEDILKDLYNKANGNIRKLILMLNDILSKIKNHPIPKVTKEIYKKYVNYEDFTSTTKEEIESEKIELTKDDESTKNNNKKDLDIENNNKKEQKKTENNKKIKLTTTQKKILKELVNKELSIGELSERTNLSYDLVSKHISDLNDRGVVIKIRCGNSIKYRLNPEFEKEILKELEN